MEPETIEPQILSNEEVRFSIHYKPACIVQYEVEALAPLVKEARRVAIKRVSKEVTLPGFRKGRAPDEMVAKNFSSAIDKEWEQAISEHAFRSCSKLAQIPMLQQDSKITYKMKSHSENGALLTLSFETEPKLPTIDPKQLKLKPVKRPVVNEEKVEETIRQIQLFFAQWKAVEGRPAAVGDFVLLDVDIIEETPATPLFNHTRFEIGEKTMAKWMRDLVIGKNVNDVVEGISIPDEDASEEDKETLKEKKVRITIKAIDEATLPPLTDEFIKQIGVNSTEELRTNIHALLNKQADAHVQEALRKQASEFILNTYTFDLPATLIEKETRFRIQQLMADNDFQSYWESLSSEERKNTFQTIHQQSEKAVRMYYLCRKIVSDAQIKISTQDIPPPATSALEFLLNPQKLFHHAKNPEMEHAEAFSRLLLEKAEDFVISNASQDA
ncbi:MAG: trigger factor [Rhabdochlamydiaceae bacterium]|nr:trigger factor [Rhabdochlamydiaceae bacterium]